MGFDGQDPTAPGDDDPMPPIPTGMARVSVEYQGAAGSGMIVGPSAFTCTAGTCTLDVPAGTSVTLRGLAATDAWFAGWSGGACGGTFDCELVVAADVTVRGAFTATPNRVFVTSTTTDGAFGGIAGGDAICEARATAVGLTGDFIAFVSDTTTSATSRLSTSRGWVRVDGAPFADAPAAFANADLIFPARLDEYGNDVGDEPIFTGTDWGASATKHCLDWTSNLGTEDGFATRSEFAGAVVGGWNHNCSIQARLLCVEIGRDVPVAIAPAPGKLAFSSTDDWLPGGGRADADAHCATSASQAGLTGTFLAAVATTTESIAERFPAGAIYRRVDGVRLLHTAGALAVDWLDVPPELDQHGDWIYNDVWTGAVRFDARATPAQNCNDWTVGDDTLDGEMHFTTRTDVRSPTKTEPCSIQVPILCLEK